MSVIAHWTLSECPDCGVLTCATAEQVQWCDEHCRSDKTVVEVVRADTYRGAVEELETLREAVRAYLNGAPLDEHGRFTHPAREVLYRAAGGGSRP